MFLWCSPGGGYPGGGQPHRVGDLPDPSSGLTLHPVLRLQALQWEKEVKEEDEGKEGPQPARFLHIIGPTTLIRPVCDLYTHTQNYKGVEQWSPFS